MLKKSRKKILCLTCKKVKPQATVDQCGTCYNRLKPKYDHMTYLCRTYSNIKNRCNNKRKTDTIYFGLEFCTKEEFINKFENDVNFLTMYKTWQKAKHKRSMSPSVDRINNKKGYTIDNIQFLILKENSGKDKEKCAVDCYMKNTNEYVGTYESQSEAGRVLRVCIPNIWKCIIGERKHAGGYTFKKST